MKKKIFLIICIIVLILLIVGACIFINKNSDSNNVEDTNENSETVDYIYNNEILKELGEFVATVASESNTMRYEVVDHVLAITDEFSLKVPMLKARDASDYMMTSEIIRNKIYDELSVYFTDGAEVTLDNYSYEATLTRDQFVSIIFSGNIFVEGAAHPSNLFITLNIDMLKEKEVKLDDFIDNQDEFIKLLKSDKAIFRGVEEAEKYVKKELSKDELKAELFENNKNVYFTEKGIAVVIEVPHAIGDYAIFEIAYEDIK